MSNSNTNSKRYSHIIYEQLSRTEEGRHKQEEENKNKNFTIVYIMFSSIFVFILSITDISFSYLNLHHCQTLVSGKELDISLNIWLRVNGIFSIIYYIILLLSFWNRKKISELRDIRYCLETVLFTSSLFSVIWLGLGTYIFLTMKCLEIYMWVRIILGFLFHIPNIIYIMCYMFT